jgi:hypothetical protein
MIIKRWFQADDKKSGKIIYFWLGNVDKWIIDYGGRTDLNSTLPGSEYLTFARIYQFY